MRKHTSSIVGGVLGVVVLAVVAVFGILLPNVEPASGSDGTSGATSAPSLPAKLGDLVALDSDQLPAALQQQIGGIAQVAQAQKQGSAGLGKVYGVPATYRFYATSDAQSLVALTVLNREPGLFSPDGPPVSTAPGQQPTYQLQKVGGAVCAEYYGQPQSSTGQPSGAVQLSRVHCQLGADGRTYDIDARGLSVAKTVAALKQATEA